MQIGVRLGKIVGVVSQVRLKGRHLRLNCGISDSRSVSFHLDQPPD